MGTIKLPKINWENYRCGFFGAKLLVASFFLAIFGIITTTPLLHIGVFPFGYLFELFLSRRIGFLPMILIVAVVGFGAGQIIGWLWQRHKIFLIPVTALLLLNSILYINHLYWLWCVNC